MQFKREVFPQKQLKIKKHWKIYKNKLEISQISEVQLKKYNGIIKKIMTKKEFLRKFN